MKFLICIGLILISNSLCYQTGNFLNLRSHDEIPLTFQNGANKFTCTESGLNTCTAPLELGNNFTINLRVSKLRSKGQITIGLTKHQINTRLGKNEWLGLSNDQWSIASNGFIGIGDSKWEINANAKFVEGDSVTIFRTDQIVGFRINNIPNDYSFTKMTGPVYLAVSLKVIGDEVQILKSTDSPSSLSENAMNAADGALETKGINDSLELINRRGKNGGGLFGGGFEDTLPQKPKKKFNGRKFLARHRGMVQSPKTTEEALSIDDQNELIRRIPSDEASQVVHKLAQATYKNRNLEEARKDVLRVIFSTSESQLEQAGNDSGSSNSSGGEDSISDNKPLMPNKSLTSPNGKYTLLCENGNLVLKDGDKEIWQSETTGMARGGGIVKLLNDGTLTLMSADDKVAYWSNSKDKNDALCPCKLKVTNKREAMVVDKEGKEIWSTHTGQIADEKGSTGKAYLSMNEILESDKQILSDNKHYRLINQKDGNIVIYDSNNKAKWYTSTNRDHELKRVIMQSDGNLVVYSKGTEKAVWSSNTPNSKVKSTPPYTAVLTNKGILEVRDNDNKVLWHSNK